MRYAISDPQSATDSYRDALVAAGFTIDLEFDHLEESSNNVGFTATNGSWSVTSSSFGADTTDGLYQAVVVQSAG